MKYASCAAAVMANKRVTIRRTAKRKERKRDPSDGILPLVANEIEIHFQLE
jgi:hypothetical protein